MVNWWGSAEAADKRRVPEEAALEGDKEWENHQHKGRSEEGIWIITDKKRHY